MRFGQIDSNRFVLFKNRPFDSATAFAWSMIIGHSIQPLHSPDQWSYAHSPICCHCISHKPKDVRWHWHTQLLILSYLKMNTISRSSLYSHSRLLLLLVKQQSNMVPLWHCSLLSGHTISFYNNQCAIVMFYRPIDDVVLVQCSLHYPIQNFRYHPYVHFWCKSAGQSVQHLTTALCSVVITDVTADVFVKLWEWLMMTE